MVILPSSFKTWGKPRKLVHIPNNFTFIDVFTLIIIIGTVLSQKL